MPASIKGLGEEVESLLVELPNELAGFFASEGYAEAVNSEDRLASRLRARCETTIEFTNPPLPLLDVVRGRANPATVLVKDLSKSGIALLFHQQIYPGEKALLQLRGREIHVAFQRCRRLGPMCYEVGAVVEKVVSIK